MPGNTSPRRNRSVAAGAAVVLVGALTFGVVSMTGDRGDRDTARPAGASAGPSTKPPTSPSASPSASPSDETAQLPDMARREAADPRAKGRPDAPVVMIEYADFQCPFCGKFARDTEPELAGYIQDGTLRIEWRDFPIFGKESEAAARAGYAAGRQGRFWEFHDAAFAKDRKRNSGAFTEPKLVEMARRAGVPDLARFRADMNGREAAKAVQRDTDEGYDLGVPSTPAFIINKRPFLGAQPLGTFKAAIEKAR
ncbi:DsbA family protein [Actinomadura formosensis]|uniref:DsbA family protein n=1 Tax=Actinomadura formosensis TaxID=60706 RepID=UPI00083715AC|nr:thioredoxin domain-containing protein [Actinomadura formosensis]